TKQGVGGLNNEAVVRYRGIRAGKVESVGVDPKDPRFIIVRISLKDDFKLTRGTTATLTMQGITGLTYISLDDNGRDPALLTAPEGELPRIALRPTLFDAMADNAVRMVNRLAAMSERLEVVFSEKNAANLERTIDNVSTASDGLRELPQVLAGLRSALSPENMKKLNATLVHLEQAAGETPALARDVRQLVANLNQVSERVEVLLGSTESAHATLPRANALMKELTDTTRQLSRLLETLDDNPQSLLFGRPQVRPGPGEAGFSATSSTTKP
ncbi:MAG: MlaD family protein, partial [Rhodocyclaceae bacterium]|nr:MlaD family protein [Rhodocyclaceae bacterium]